MLEAGLAKVDLSWELNGIYFMGYECSLLH